MGQACSCCRGCGNFRRVWSPQRVPSEMPLTPLPKPPPGESMTDSPSGKENAVLTVENVDLCIPHNGPIHHTERFELMTRSVENGQKSPRLIVRRGQPFRLILNLNRPYNEDKDGVSFIFTVADVEKPSYGQGTLIGTPLLKKGNNGGEGAWVAVVESAEGNNLQVLITSAADCIVSQWKMDIDTKVVDGGAVSYSLPSPFYVLFNPWNKKDQVYMKDETLRDEYVLSDTGLIWRGSYNRLRPAVWKYAQFEKDILDCSLYLITHIGKVVGRNRSDPVRTCRALSAAVNSPDDNGCIMGNWSDDFGGGTPPTKWVGSMEIMQQFYKKKKPVKYGQCWVFSGVLASICRAIGIPVRVITTYSSAHDTQSSLTVDYFVDDKGAVMEELNSDSIWNYHVWNEVWMNRPDLHPVSEYGGWQAIDATPQELSDDMYRCGPASVVAVKQGEVLRPYDNSFLFAEVNADKVFWRYAGPTQPLKLLRKDMYGIGQFISTKAVGKWEREDVTSTYKYPEKSEQERAAMLRALRQSESIFSRYYLNEDFNDIKFDFELRDDIKIGEPFSVVLLVKNRSRNTDHSVSGTLRVDTVLYTGKVKDAVKKINFDKKVTAGAIEEIRLNVDFNEYFSRLCNQCAFNIACMATVKDTQFEYFAQDDFRVRKPDIKFHLGGTPTAGQPLEVTVKLQNPLPIPLKKGQFQIEGPGMAKQLKLSIKETIAAGAGIEGKFLMTPEYWGRTSLVAKFTSKELDDVDGFLAFEVQQAKEVTNGTH